jgi:hypothetical protein
MATCNSRGARLVTALTQECCMSGWPLGPFDDSSGQNLRP